MSDKRDAVRDRIININDTCIDCSQSDYGCMVCPYSAECFFLRAFDEWHHIQTHREAGDEDLERLVDSVMTVEDYEDLLKPDKEV